MLTLRKCKKLYNLREYWKNKKVLNATYKKIDQKNIHLVFSFSTSVGIEKIFSKPKHFQELLLLRFTESIDLRNVIQTNHAYLITEK